MRWSFWRWTKFSAVGSIGMVVHLGLLAVFVKVCGMHYLLATVLSVETAVLHNFVWHCRWTWADRSVAGVSAVAAALLRFHLSNGLVSIAGNLFFMHLFAGVMRVDPLVASLLSIAPCALINFLISDRWVFLSAAAGLDLAATSQVGGEPFE
ncbi:MAG: GtrA family protein [Acidobacteria bacterium]|nr:GtrA family protein [Acidobacteriota bacterium]